MAQQPPKKRVHGENPIPAAPLVNEFNLQDEERFLFDLWAVEHTHIAGTEIEYWSLNVPRSIRDPLYDEPVERKWDGPFKMKGWLEWPNGTPEAREEGFRTTYTGSIWLARKEFEEANCPTPNEGDVIRVWNTPFYQDFGVDGEDVPGRGYYFNIVNVNDDGHVFDQSTFVGFRCDIGRATEFTPERRLMNK